MDNWYVYAYFDLDGTPIYIGKGVGNRIERHMSRSQNQHLHNKIQKLKREGLVCPHSKVIEGLTEGEANVWEVVLIEAFGRVHLKTGTLYNFTDGGEGSSGLKHSETAKQKMSINQKKRYEDPEARKKTSDATMKYYADNPDAKLKNSERRLKYWEDNIEAREAAAGRAKVQKLRASFFRKTGIKLQ